MRHFHGAIGHVALQLTLLGLGGHRAATVVALQIPGGSEEAAAYLRIAAAGDDDQGQHGDAEMLLTRTNATASGWHGQHPGSSSGKIIADLAKQLVVPVIALAVGGLMHWIMPRLRVAAQISMFFGAQTFMNIYMKAVLSQTIVSEEFKMRGFQAPLMLTALQQLVAFVFLSILIALSHIAGMPYRPKRITTMQEAAMILTLSVTFTLNIALNNFSLSLLDISANVMIRSASPLSALLLQVGFSRWLGSAADLRLGKLMLVISGVLCTVLVVISKRKDANGDHPLFLLGIVLCLSSLFFSNLELVIVAALSSGKSKLKLNCIDTLLYMAIPIVIILMLPSLFLLHPVTYTNFGNTTDWRVFIEICKINAVPVMLVLLSGIWAVCYNLLLYIMVRDLSPVFATFAGSFNKAAAIALALLLQFEHLPSAPWGFVMVLGVIGNMSFFTGFALFPKPVPEDVPHVPCLRPGSSKDP